MGAARAAASVLSKHRQRRKPAQRERRLRNREQRLRNASSGALDAKSPR
jgi:hypothetical protein